MRNLLYIMLLILVASCVGGATDGESSGKDTDTIVTVVTPIDTALLSDTALLDLTPRQVDSIVFRLTHHYTNNFNFLVKSDSLRLLPRDGDLLQDTCYVRDGDLIAVAEIKVMPADTIDTIWVKVAHDQYTMGWVAERDLLQHTTPSGMISQLLDTLSSSRAVWMTALVLVGMMALAVRRRKPQRIRLFDFSKMTSPYPFVFIAFVAIMASLYASVQNFVPEFWQEYYFNPTLNPLVLPPIMASLVVVMWLVVILFVAVIDEVYAHLSVVDGLLYLAELIGVAMVVYLVVSWTTLIYIGYIVLAALLLALTVVGTKVVRRSEYRE